MAVDYSKFRASKDEVESFYKKPFDKVAAREKMVARITRTLKQLNGEPVSPRGGKDFETLEANGVVYRPTLNGQSIEFAETDGEDGFHATRSQLAAMLPEFARDVEAGEFDDELQRALESKPVSAVTPKAATRGGAGKPRKSSLPDRADGIPHRVAASEDQPHESYTMNKAKTFWRSPEQVEADDKRAKQRLATAASKKS